MKQKISFILQKIAELGVDGQYWVDQIGKFDLKMDKKDDPVILKQIHSALSDIPVSLIKDCGINEMSLRGDMGPNRQHSPNYPNHGYYVNNSITLNSDIFHHPDDFTDEQGYFMARPRQTLYHELGHGYDEYNGFPSYKDDWLKLSGWSQTHKPGLKRLFIKGVDNAPDVLGEWFYDPKAGFTRPYGKRNNYDDYADCFCFYIGGLKSKLPENKIEYFDKKLGKYFK